MTSIQASAFIIKDTLFSSYDLMLIEHAISNLTINNENIRFSVVLDVEVVFNGTILESLANENIDVKTFPKANHVLKKSFDPSIDSEFDFPRIIEGYTAHVQAWIENKIAK